jgi:hypothetical protein
MNIYPDVAIVLVTSHGTVKINPNTQQPYTFNVPENTSVTLLSAVTPGVCNFWDTDDTQHFTEYLLKKLKNKEEVEILKENPIAFINSLVEILKGYDVKMINDLYKKQKNKDDEYDPDEAQFIYHHNKSYVLRSHKQGDNLINKEFSRNNRTEQNESAWNFKILLMNKLGVPDIIREIHGRNNQDENTYVTFEEIVNYLKNDGVENIIFLDLSCSNFVESTSGPQSRLADIDDDEENNETGDENIENLRKIRSIRRNILKTVKGGRRRRKPRRHTKRRQRRTKRRKYKINFK